MKTKGEFWPAVRERIWQKAEELYIMDHRQLDCWNRPERNELVEGGYFYRAKIIVLHEERQYAK